MYNLQKKLVQNAHSCVKQELKHFTTPYMQLPKPAVFHDKGKRTQQENLLDLVLTGETNKTVLTWVNMVGVTHLVPILILPVCATMTLKFLFN